MLPVAFDPEPEPDEVPPVEGDPDEVDPDEVDPDVDPGLLVIGPDWMEVGALVASGPFLGLFPRSLLHFGVNLPPLKVLPLELPIRPMPVGIMTLENRTISPVAQLFIDCARELTKPLARRG